jgi:hypothetical protein
LRLRSELFDLVTVDDFSRIPVRFAFSLILIKDARPVAVHGERVFSYGSRLQDVTLCLIGSSLFLSASSPSRFWALLVYNRRSASESSTKGRQ